MNSTKDILQHVARTIVLVFILAVIFSLVIVVGIMLRVPPSFLLILLMVLVLAVIYYSARWHAIWAPVGRVAARIKWQLDDGTQMMTAIEQAHVVRSSNEILRVSIYRTLHQSLVRRVLIGDSAELVCIVKPAIWFYIRDAFHARRDGLIAIDLRTGDWIYHEARRELELPDEYEYRDGRIQVIRNGQLQTLDLRQLTQQITSGQIANNKLS